MDTLRIAIAGVGTVGSGLLELIDKNKKFIQSKIEKNIKVKAIAKRKRQEKKILIMIPLFLTMLRIF